MAEQTAVRPTVEEMAAGLAWLRETAAAHAARLAPVYAALDWRWGNDAATPTAAEIHSTILRVAKMLEQEPAGTMTDSEPDRPGVSSRAMHTGGLEVGVGVDPGVGPGVQAWVRFVDVQHEGVA
ncbi:MAG TPA: hypothetical protein VM389_14400 [Phycisphaerae bacterium]|nr:hypothetical protein [Phycisphaerae bacterium]HUU58440.1 hypothetical protein [Phycisphaerae bacterium]